MSLPEYPTLVWFATIKLHMKKIANVQWKTFKIKGVYLVAVV